jgi:hypothetical protein
MVNVIMLIMAVIPTRRKKRILNLNGKNIRLAIVSPEKSHHMQVA